VPIVTVQQLVERGVHFGHQASHWNPKMRPFIHGKRNLIHVIDLRETIKGLLRARNFLMRMAAKRAQILFVARSVRSRTSSRVRPSAAACRS
jgi:small subunit ribosomal protein S2